MQPEHSFAATRSTLAVGAVLVALVAGLVSLLGLIVSELQRSSKFRQALIDAFVQRYQRLSVIAWPRPSRISFPLK